MKTVAILGASTKEHRYAYQAQQMLMDMDYPVYPVSLKGTAIRGVPGYTRLTEITDKIDTLTLYVGAAHLEPMLQDILDLSPRRVIFNPGTESALAGRRLRDAGIETLEACTLVLLSTGQFETA